MLEHQLPDTRFNPRLLHDVPEHALELLIQALIPPVGRIDQHGFGPRNEGIGQRVEGHDVRQGRPVKLGLQALRHLCGGVAIEGKQQHLARTDAAVILEEQRPVRDGLGLPTPRPGRQLNMRRHRAYGG